MLTVRIPDRVGSIVDQALDWTVLPGFSRIGYCLRENLVPRGPLRLQGRTAMVTGANSGIGEAACVGLAAAGATVQMVVRDVARGESARERIAAASGSDRLVLRRCDVSSLASVRELAAAYLGQGDPLHVLVNNAGVLPSTRSLTDEGFELTFATNVLGPFLLTALLLPALRRSAPARVVNVSSGGMYSARIDVVDPQLKRARVRRHPVLRAHQAGRGDSQRGVGEAAGRRRDRGPLDAPGLGGDRGSRRVAAAVPEGDGTAPA